MSRLLKLVEGEPAARVLDRLIESARCCEIGREALQHPCVLALQRLRLEELPVVELDAVAQPEPGQEVAAVEICSLGVAHLGDTASKLAPRRATRRVGRARSRSAPPRGNPLRAPCRAPRACGEAPRVRAPRHARARREQPGNRGSCALPSPPGRPEGRRPSGYRPSADRRRSRSGAARGARSSAGP